MMGRDPAQNGTRKFLKFQAKLSSVNNGHGSDRARTKQTEKREAARRMFIPLSVFQGESPCAAATPSQSNTTDATTEQTWPLPIASPPANTTLTPNSSPGVAPQEEHHYPSPWNDAARTKESSGMRGNGRAGFKSRPGERQWGGPAELCLCWGKRNGGGEGRGGEERRTGRAGGGSEGKVIVVMVVK